MNDEALAALLRTLPRHEASAGFTSRVMGGAVKRAARRRARLRAFAAAVVVTSICGGVLAWRTERERREATRHETLVAEQAAIRSELDHLREAAEAYGSVILVADDEVEYVIDLRTPEQQRSRPIARMLDVRDY